MFNIYLLNPNLIFYCIQRLKFFISDTFIGKYFRVRLLIKHWHKIDRTDKSWSNSKHFHFLLKTPQKLSFDSSPPIQLGWKLVHSSGPPIHSTQVIEIRQIFWKLSLSCPQKFLSWPSLLQLPPGSSCQVFQPPLSPLLACRMAEGGGHLRPGSTVLLPPAPTSSWWLRRWCSSWCCYPAQY